MNEGENVTFQAEFDDPDMGILDVKWYVDGNVIAGVVGDNLTISSKSSQRVWHNFDVKADVDGD